MVGRRVVWVVRSGRPWCWIDGREFVSGDYGGKTRLISETSGGNSFMDRVKLTSSTLPIPLQTN